MKKLDREKIVAAVLLIMALALLLAGSFRTHRVYETDSGEFGILTFHRISELEMVEDATFHGVAREGGRLYTTYDRSQPRGKTACPT